MKPKTCCVMGYKYIPANQVRAVRAALNQEVKIAINDGYTYFISGFAEGADIYFAEVVTKKKLTYDIELEAAIAYRRRYNELIARKGRKKLLDACAKIHVEMEAYGNFAPQSRNRYILNQSERMIIICDPNITNFISEIISMAQVRNMEIRTIAIDQMDAN